MTPQERSELLDALLEGEISEADFLRIEAELPPSTPEVRKEYYRRLELDLMLEREADEQGPPPEKNAKQKRTSWTGRVSLLAGMLLGIAASLLFVVFYSMWFSGPDTVSPDTEIAEKTEPSANGFAVLSGQAEAVWADRPIGMGSLLPEGRLHLKSGLVHVEFFSGVQMVIQGDSVFSVDSAMQVTLHSGRARAHVPEPAQGFRVKTASGDVVDLGTEFSINVKPGGTDVQVVDGEVELHPKQSQVKRIQQGTSATFSEEGTLVDGTNPNISLMGPAEFQSQLARQQSSQFARWKKSADMLKNDSRLIAYYQVNPDKDWSRRLDNLGIIASDGAIVAARTAEDRWGRSSGALDFSPMGSRVRVNVPGEYRGLTLWCWVKINSLDRWYNSLFLTDGHEDREPHWQIMNDGRIFFSVKIPPKAGEKRSQQHVFYSPSFWTPALSGRWVMLCTTYDVEHKKVIHYVNGEPISTESIPDEFLIESIRIGPASICNWSEPMYRTDPTFVVRNLNGSLDEFVILSGALTSEEIQSLYRTGNPNEH